MNDKAQSWRWWPGVALAGLILLASHGLVWELSSPSAYRQDTQRAEHQTTKSADHDGFAALFRIIGNGWAAGATTIATIVLAYIAASQHSTIRRESRAYIFPQKIMPEITKVTDDLTIVTLVISWENTGKTPAKRVVTDINHAIFSGGIPTGFGFPCFQSNGQKSRPVGPGHVAPAQRTIDANDVKDAAINSKRIFFWGWIEYSDAFAWTKRRRTEFSTELRLLGAWGTPDFNLQSIIVDGFNGADGDCAHRPRTKG